LVNLLFIYPVSRVTTTIPSHHQNTNYSICITNVGASLDASRVSSIIYRIVCYSLIVCTQEGRKEGSIWCRSKNAFTPSVARRSLYSTALHCNTLVFDIFFKSNFNLFHLFLFSFLDSNSDGRVRETKASACYNTYIRTQA